MYLRLLSSFTTSKSPFVSLYGKGYRYPHHELDAYAVGENYFPEKLKNRRYYYPVDRGLEIQIAEKLIGKK